MSKKILIFGGLLFLIFFVLTNYINISPKDMLAGVFFVDSLTERQLKAKDNVRILIVPGHDDEYWGTEFNGIKEADLNVELAEYLTNYLRQEKDFQVYLLRNKQGYDGDYLNYIKNNKEDIFNFQKKHQDTMSALTSSGLVDSEIRFNSDQKSLSEVVTRLYGINKWSNEESMDIVIHVHFNDYPGRYSDWVGKYSGLTIYIPDEQYSNHKISFSIARSVSSFLGKYFAYSDLKYEKGQQGIKENQEFIALGSFNTLDAAGLLVEYGYIYEPQFTNSNTRQPLLKEMAWQTYLSLADFFSKDLKKDNLMLPYQWDLNLSKGMNNNEDVLAMQFLLSQQGFYPPYGYNLNDCPISGSFGNCTLRAVKDFQTEYSIIPTSGFVGELTRNKLNEFE
ncbi:MAG: N-acetylmuramoyl-L-alanine amidase [Patescibacteria group bacterium]|nr:N-acetylmuramoyl-L-alanine amidase [Patescibacteria group bacterium]